MDEKKQMTPAPYAAGTGSVPVTPDRAAFDRMGYRERLALKGKDTPAANRKRGNHKKVEGRAYPAPTKQSDLKRRKIYV